MASELRALADVVEDILDRRGVTPFKLGGDFVSSGHRVISAKLVKGGRVDLDADEARYVDAAIYKKWMKSSLRRDDVIMTSEAPLGELAYLNQSVDWVLGQRLFAIRPRKGVLSGKFLYYALATKGVRNRIVARASGTTVQGIRQAELRKVEIPVPPLQVQVQAADILGALDDRIDNLRQANVTLEAIAQALFKSWFVDFDPVRAKAEGREPEGMDDATAALFPSEFEDSELGPVPKGWRSVKSGEAFDVGIGKTPPRKEAHWFSEDSRNVPWASIRDMGESGCFLAGTSEYLTREAVARFNVRVAPAGTVLMSFKLTVGRVAIADCEMATNEAIAHFKEKPGSVPKTFFYCFLKSFDMRSLASTSSIATATNSKAIREMRFLHPGDALAGAFDRFAKPLFEQIKNQQRQAAILAATRDTLLPRLIFGKLRLPEEVRQALAEA